MPWDISSSTKAYRTARKIRSAGPAKRHSCAGHWSRAASEQTNPSSIPPSPFSPSESSRSDQSCVAPIISPLSKIRLFSTPAGKAAPSSVPTPPPPRISRRGQGRQSKTRFLRFKGNVARGSRRRYRGAAFVAFTVILGAIVAFDSFLDEQALRMATSTIPSHRLDHGYTLRKPMMRRRYSTWRPRLGSVASGDDEVLPAAIANDFADCVLSYNRLNRLLPPGLDADAYADWAMRSLPCRDRLGVSTTLPDEATVYYYANSYRSYDVAREVCYAIADGVDAQEALSNACANAEMGYELF